MQAKWEELRKIFTAALYLTIGPFFAIPRCASVEGYGTMDAIAGLAFGIVIINVVRDLGVEKDGDVARETVKAGVFTGILMAVIYILTIIMGAQSRGLFELSDNGGIALTQISAHYLGGFGALYLLLQLRLPASRPLSVL